MVPQGGGEAGRPARDPHRRQDYLQAAIQTRGHLDAQLHRGLLWLPGGSISDVPPGTLGVVTISHAGGHNHPSPDPPSSVVRQTLGRKTEGEVEQQRHGSGLWRIGGSRETTPACLVLGWGRSGADFPPEGTRRLYLALRVHGAGQTSARQPGDGRSGGLMQARRVNASGLLERAHAHSTRQSRAASIGSGPVESRNSGHHMSRTQGKPARLLVLLGG